MLSIHLTNLRQPGRQLAHGLLPATVVMVVTLAGWAISLLAEARGHQHVDLVVTTVAVGLPLGRTELERPSRPAWLPIAVLPLAAAAAGYLGAELARDQWLSDALLVLALAATIWIRRFGPVATKAGTLAGLPLVAALVTPYVPQSDLSRAVWSAVMAATCAVLALIGLEAARRAFGDRIAGQPQHRPHARRKPATTRTRRLRPSTRMAVQLAAALTLGFAIGRNLYPAHWQWPVLTAFLVSSGNRGRADVLRKGILRTTGACAGTVAVALLTGTRLTGPPAPGDHRAVAAIFAVLWLALAARPLSYAYWAAGVTAALALLYSYFGVGGVSVLAQRLEGIGLGAVAAIGCAWLILPIPAKRAKRVSALS